METSKQFELTLSPETLTRWLVARDDQLTACPDRGAVVPLSFLVFLRMQPILGMSIHQWLERDPDRGMYGGVSYRSLGPFPRVGMRLLGRSHVESRKQVESPRGILVITTLLTVYRSEGVDLLSESVRMIDLPADAGVAGAKAQSPGQSIPPEWPRVAELTGLTRRQLAWMTVETGDLNRLHLDAAYAKGRGFEDVVVPAPLLNALVEKHLSRSFGTEISDLDLRYHAATHPDTPMDMFARQDGDRIEFQLHAAGCLRVEGRARFNGARSA